MNPPNRTLLNCLATLGLLFTTMSGWAESQLAAPGGGASASLNFRIIIPPVIRVLENSHPEQLVEQAGGGWSGQQRLVVLSNMKRGFCVTLRQTDPQLQAWQLSTAAESGVTLSPVTDGYRLCTTRPGRYTLLLDHSFGANAGAERVAMRWPVQTDLMAM